MNESSAWKRAGGDLAADLYDSVQHHIRHQYEGVFSNAQMAQHFIDYVELGLSQKQLELVQRMANLRPGQRLLDLGCGFGSFVLVCRKFGVEAIGVDIADFELDFARRRLACAMPDLEPESMYLRSEAEATRLDGQAYDFVTAWNLFEHVPDYRAVLREAYRLLMPGGVFFGIAPNYCGFREEAHYHVPWLPLLPRPIARVYLKLLGKRADFFDQSIFYVTNWGVLSELRKYGFSLSCPRLMKVENPHLISSSSARLLIETIKRWRLRWLLKALVTIDFWNPFNDSIFVAARKPK